MKRPIVLGMILCLMRSSVWSMEQVRTSDDLLERQKEEEVLSQPLLRLLEERCLPRLSKGESLQPFIDFLAQNADTAGTDLHYGCFAGDYDLVRRLLDNGSHVNVQGSQGYTPLHLAAQNGHKEVCELLVSSGAMINAQNSRGWTPLYLAAFQGHREVCELLINRGAPVGAQGSQDLTPLHLAAFNGHKEICELLINRGAGVNIPLNQDFVFNNIRYRGCTALHLAVFKGNLEVVNSPDCSSCRY